MKGFIIKFIPMVAGQVLEFHSPQSKSACSKWVPASGPLHPHSCLSLCPRRCHGSSLCSAAAMQPRVPVRALYIEPVIITYGTHMCSEQANLGQVRILTIGTFIFSTNRKTSYNNRKIKGLVFIQSPLVSLIFLVIKKIT